jgi:hypothetical protein
MKCSRGIPINQLPPHILKLNQKILNERMQEPVSETGRKRKIFVDLPEKELQEQIAGYLRIRSVWFARNRMDRPTTTTLGQPDFLIALHGNAVGIEVKRAGEDPTKEQKECHAAMRQNGWTIYVVYSLEEVKKILDALK